MKKTMMLLSLIGLVGCDMNASVAGNGVAKTEAREIAAFDSIELGGAFDLEFSTGPQAKLSISGDENLLPLVSASVASGKLVLRQSKNLRPKTPLLVSVQAPALHEVDISGVGSARVIAIKVPTFVLEVSGAGSAELAGEVDRLDLRLSGAGKVRALNLVAREVKVDLSGAGAAEVNATESLIANVSGVGAVRYQGAPKVEKHVNGIGSVSPL